LRRSAKKLVPMQVVPLDVDQMRDRPRGPLWRA
jgi:hypothetical protein